MRLEIELWHLIVTTLTLFGFLASGVKYLFDQQNKGLDTRAQAQDKAREEGQKSLRATLSEHIAEERKNADALKTLERDFLKWQADLPIHYVRREDYVRGQAIIEAKLDALFAKVEVVQIQGAQHHA